MNKIILAFLAAVLDVSLLVAAPGTDLPRQTFAVVVGIDRCADEQIKPRANAERDARAIVEFLNRKENVVSDQVQVTLLLGSKEQQQASKANIIKALQDVAGRAGADDLVLFVFFGQAGPVGERLGLFAVDSTFKDRANDAITSAEIEQAIDKLPARLVALLDVGFKDFDAGTEKVGDANLATLFRTFLGRDDHAEQPPPAGRVVCLASSNRRTSLDNEQQGIFTKALLEGLQGKADVAGYEPDGVVTAEELMAHLAKRIPELARAHGKTNEAKAQTPLIIGSRKNHFAVGRNTAVADKMNQRLERFAMLVKERELPAELAEEGRRMLGRMPPLFAEQELRKLYQQLADGQLAVPAFARRRVGTIAAGRQLRTDAEQYAADVLDAVRFVQTRYIRDLKNGELVAWAGQGLCARANDPRTLTAVKEQLDRCRSLADDDLRRLLADIRESLGRRPDLANHRDVEMSFLELASKLDAYTGYVDSRRVADFKRLVTGSSTGIGVRIGKDAKSNQLQVVTPIKDGPAYQAGLRGGDIITRIVRETDGMGARLEKPDVAATKGMSVGDASQRLMGKAGTPVRLMVQRAGKPEPFEVAVVRAEVEEETVLGVRRKDNDDWDWRIDTENGIGYVRLTQFNRNTAPTLRKAMKQMESENIHGLVLDLRSNPGGLLQSAVDVSRLFIDDGLIVTIRPRVGEQQAYLAETSGRYRSFPMAVLVNGQSASASEIVSACLQDHGRAVVVGERSFGKGSVQNYMDYPATGGLIRLTIATFWRPSGANLNRSSTTGSEAETWGVRPTEGYGVKLSGPERDAILKYQRATEIIPCREGQAVPEAKPAKDRQLDAALEYLRRQIEVGRESPAKKAA